MKKWVNKHSLLCKIGVKGREKDRSRPLKDKKGHFKFRPSFKIRIKKRTPQHHCTFVLKNRQPTNKPIMVKKNHHANGNVITLHYFSRREGSFELRHGRRPSRLDSDVDERQQADRRCDGRPGKDHGQGKPLHPRIAELQRRRRGAVHVQGLGCHRRKRDLLRTP
jgi:hypothetical protein